MRSSLVGIVPLQQPPLQQQPPHKLSLQRQASQESASASIASRSLEAPRSSHVLSTSPGGHSSSFGGRAAQSRERIDFEDGGFPPLEGNTKNSEAKRALSKHAFFAGLRDGAVEAFARTCSRRDFHVPSNYDPGTVLLAENTSEWSGDFLYVLERGRVTVEEGGEHLGALEDGTVFGDAVAFGFAEQQPVTVRLGEAHLVAWCVPNAAVRFLTRQMPMMMETLQANMARQWKKLFFNTRVAKTSFFAHCGRHFLQQVERKLTVDYAVAGQQLFAAGDKADSAIIVVRGSCTINDDADQWDTIAAAADASDASPAATAAARAAAAAAKTGEVHECARKSLSEKVLEQRKLSRLRKRASADRTDAPDDVGDALGGMGPAQSVVARSDSAEVALRASLLEARRRAGSSSEGSSSGLGDESWDEEAMRVVASRKETEKSGAGSMGQASAEEGGDGQLRRRRSSSDAGSTSSSSSSSSSGSSSGFSEEDGARRQRSSPVEYMLPETLACLEPEGMSVTATAGRGSALIFGDGALLGFQERRPRTVVAKRDCIFMVFQSADFMWLLARHQNETKRYVQMQTVAYQEWFKCGADRLSHVDIFRCCTAPFLSCLAGVVQPRLYFAGEAIVDETSSNRGDLVLLMAGVAEQVDPNTGAKAIVHCPQTFGSLQWLGAKSEPCRSLRAKDICQVLQIRREDLLETLKRYPDESTTMVSQVRRHNGQRVSLVNRERSAMRPVRTSTHASTSQGHVLDLQGLRFNMWHVPFCKGCDPGFLEWFTLAMEHGKLIPGMPLLRGGDNADFMIVLTDGTIEVHDKDDVHGGPMETNAPLIVCGWDRTRAVEATAKTICEVHRLGVHAVGRLAAEFPVDTQKVLKRLMNFQVRVANAQGQPWWLPVAALKRLPPFQESSRAFLDAAAQLFKLEVYVPGDAIVEEGAAVDSTLIVECGRCNVEKRSAKSLWTFDIVNEVSDGHWIGGVGGVCGFAGELKRKATVRATTVCKVHRIPTAELVQILGCTPTERQRFRSMAERELRAKDSERLEDHAFFKDFTRTFLNLLRPKCRVQVFFANEPLMRQGEPADSLYILGSESSVVLEVDGHRVKEIHGRHCLGILALIGPRPTHRASTVYTLTACAVRVLTREDWQDALKLYPEHREWIERFTAEQVEQIREAREGLLRRRAWDKIKERDSAAKSAYWERRGRGAFGPAPEKGPASGRPPADGSRQGKAPPSARSPGGLGASAKAAAPRLSGCRERWPCFNGAEALMPGLQLPRLNTRVDEAPETPSPDDHPVADEEQPASPLLIRLEDLDDPEPEPQREAQPPASRRQSSAPGTPGAGGPLGARELAVGLTPRSKQQLGGGIGGGGSAARRASGLRFEEAKPPSLPPLPGIAEPG